MSLSTENALFEIIRIGAAAQRLHIVVGLQNCQVHTRQHCCRFLRHIAGVRQNPHASAGSVQTETAGAGGVMRSGGMG